MARKIIVGILLSSLLLTAGCSLIVKTAFGQRRKTLRNSLKPIYADRSLSGAEGPVFDLRPERLSVEDFIDLTLRLTP